MIIEITKLNSISKHNFVLVDPPFVGGVGVKPMFWGFEITIVLTVTCNCEVRSDTITVTKCNDTTVSTLGHQLRQGGGGHCRIQKAPDRGSVVLRLLCSVLCRKLEIHSGCLWRLYMTGVAKNLD